jgi:hypothetical protein
VEEGEGGEEEQEEEEEEQEDPREEECCIYHIKQLKLLTGSRWPTVHTSPLKLNIILAHALILNKC